MSSAGNQTIGFAPHLLRRRRNRLLWSVLAAGLILVASATAAVVGWHRQRSTPRPDYFKTFLSDLAEQHYRLTGTPTVVKENELVTEYLNRLYSRKARRDMQPAEMVSASHDGLSHFSFLPGTIGWQEYPFAYLAEQQTAPALTFSEPSGKPLALWVFSRAEQALAIIFAEEPVLDDLADPGLRIIDTVNRSGAVAVTGEFKAGQVVLVHAYLLPLNKMQLGAAGAWTGTAAALEQIVGSVPLLFGAGARSTTGQMRLDAGQSLDRLEAVAPPGFFKVARVAQWVVFPAALLCLTWILFCLRKAQREWNQSLPRLIPHDPAVLHFGFLRFLTADLVVEAEKVLTETAERRREESLRHQEQLRRERFQTEIHYCLRTLADLGQESPCDEEWLGAASTADLEDIAARCRQTVERHQGQVEKERQAARERERQIHWLESEFAAVPPSKRQEMVNAWALYEQACAASDPGKKLETLKTARKLLPKEFRDDQQ